MARTLNGVRLPRPRRSRPFTVPVAKPESLARQQLPYYWHPGRLGVEHAPAWFAAQLTALHPGLACTRHQAAERGAWILWSRNPEQTHPLCPGWTLLFVWADPETKDPLPLDARVLYNLYRRDPRRYRDARQYFDQAETELKEAADRRQHDFDNESESRRKEFRQFTKIKSIGRGSKFALHHDDTVAPSRG